MKYFFRVLSFVLAVWRSYRIYQFIRDSIDDFF